GSAPSALSPGIGHSPRQHRPKAQRSCGDGHRAPCVQPAYSPRQARRRLEAAVDAFLSQPGFSDQTRRSYRKTLAALVAALEAAGAEPTATAIEAAAKLRWGAVAPATWNRHAATIRSFL